MACFFLEFLIYHQKDSCPTCMKHNGSKPALLGPSLAVDGTSASNAPDMEINTSLLMPTSWCIV